jgi:hypothetical protein
MYGYHLRGSKIHRPNIRWLYIYSVFCVQKDYIHQSRFKRKLTPTYWLWKERLYRDYDLKNTKPYFRMVY